MIEVAEYTL